MSSKEIEIFEKSDKCKLIFDRFGNIEISGDCDGESINPVELSGLARMREILDDEAEN